MTQPDEDYDPERETELFDKGWELNPAETEQNE